MPVFDSTHVDQPVGVIKVPFASFENFADCVAKNKGKVGDPEAYCASIQRKVEGEDVNVVNEVLMELGELGDDNVLRGAQLMPIGSWDHPLGEIKITPERAVSFANQYKRAVTGQRIPVLYIHSDKANVSNPKFGRAAGWMTDVRADENLGVVVDIEFNEEGAKAVKDKEFAYLSAEYFDKVQLPHHDAPEDDVIVAAALVNRPHLKGMQPLLNEETGHQFLLGEAEKPIKGGGPMDPILRQLCEQAQIELSSEQTELTDEQSAALKTFLEKREKDNKDTSSKVTLLEEKLTALEDPDKTMTKSLEEAGFGDEAKLLSEYRADRLVKSLGEFVPKEHQLSPAAEKVARVYALEQTPENLENLHKVMLSGAGVVDLSEIGTSRRPAPTDDEDSDALAAVILEESTKISVEQKISLADAMSVYAKDNPDKWNEYQDSQGATMAKVEVS